MPTVSGVAQMTQQLTSAASSAETYAGRPEGPAALADLLSILARAEATYTGGVRGGASDLEWSRFRTAITQTTTIADQLAERYGLARDSSAMDFGGTQTPLYPSTAGLTTPTGKTPQAIDNQIRENYAYSSGKQPSLASDTNVNLSPARAEAGVAPLSTNPLFWVGLAAGAWVLWYVVKGR